MALSISNIEDKKLKTEVKKLINYLKKLQAGKASYDPNLIESMRDNIINSFSDFITNKQVKVAKKYEINDQEFLNNFNQERQNIIDIFTQNVTNAFETAIDGIEKDIRSRPLTIPGIIETFPLFFGIRQIFSLFNIKKTISVEKDEISKITGLSKLTTTGKRHTMNLVSYILTLIRMAQDDFKRRLAKSISSVGQIDLGRISPEPSFLGENADEVCNRWRDKIVSISGNIKEFPHLQNALNEKPPLFHPNCKHKLIMLTRKEQNIAIATQSKTFTELKQKL